MGCKAQPTMLGTPVGIVLKFRGRVVAAMSDMGFIYPPSPSGGGVQNPTSPIATRSFYSQFPTAAELPFRLPGK